MRRLLLLLALGLAASACAGRIPPPYARGAAPDPQVLLDATEPRMRALQVPLARVRVRGMRANLAYIAQGPDRFRGQIQVAGKELATLAFHERAYGLRYLLDAHPQGFYGGEPSPCAVQALLGIPLHPRDLVAVVLGGTAIIEGDVVDQRWDRRAGRERLVLQAGGTRQELLFVRGAGAWWFAGASLWRGDALIWTVAHEDFEGIDGLYLPRRTRLSRPTAKRDLEVVITYRDRIVDPPFVLEAAPTQSQTPDDGGLEDDEGWEEDGGWEDGSESPDRTTEAHGGPGSPGVGAAHNQIAGGPDPDDGAVDPAAAQQPVEATAPGSPAPTPIPALFILDPGALVQRGALCRD